MKNGSVDLPDQVPVMPLPGAVLFPHALLPLYIFEPRYREMLEHALKHRSHVYRHSHQTELPRMARPRRFFSPRHGRPNSRLRWSWRRHIQFVLQGLQRVRFANFEQETPFPIAKIDIVESATSRLLKPKHSAKKCSNFTRKLKRAGRRLPPKVDRYLAQLGDMEMLADLIASTFVNDPLRRQQMLEKSSLNQRLRLLITYLQDEIGSAAA